jgi:hypothetical protein
MGLIKAAAQPGGEGTDWRVQGHAAARNQRGWGDGVPGDARLRICPLPDRFAVTSFRTATLARLHALTREGAAPMQQKPPPVPAENRSPEGPGSDPETETNVKTGRDQAKPPEKENTAQQGDRANVRQNTTNQGYNQGR